MAQGTSLFQNRTEWRSIVRFAIVGLLGTCIDLAAFTFLRVGLNLPTLPANTLAYSAGILNGFIWHRQWTFADRPRKAVRAQFLQFAVVSLSALIVNNLIVLFLAPQFLSSFGNAASADLAAKLCATALGLGWNFFANNLWTFRAANNSM